MSDVVTCRIARDYLSTYYLFLGRARQFIYLFFVCRIQQDARSHDVILVVRLRDRESVSVLASQNEGTSTHASLLGTASKSFSNLEQETQKRTARWVQFRCVRVRVCECWLHDPGNAPTSQL